MILAKSFGKPNLQDPRDTDDELLMDTSLILHSVLSFLQKSASIDTTDDLYGYWQKCIQQNKWCDMSWSLPLPAFLLLEGVHGLANLKLLHTVISLAPHLLTVTCADVHVPLSFLQWWVDCNCSKGYTMDNWQYKWCTYLWIL